MAGLLQRLFGRSEPDSSRVLQEKYLSFRELLAANNEALQIIADMAEKLQGETVFGMGYVRSRCTDLAVQTYKIIDHLERITGRKEEALAESFRRINLAMQEGLAMPHKEGVAAFVLPFSEISADHLDDVGGKSLNLALMQRDAGVPVPPGFAVTARAWELFAERNRLQDRVNSEKVALSDHPAAIEEAARRIAAIFESAALPEEVAAAILAAYGDLRRQSGCERVSVRSSAVGEDAAESSFAGLHASVLGVGEADLLDAYRRVLASKYTPRAIFYRLSRGIRDEEVAMCATCMAMVEAARSGVAFCRDPGGDDDSVVIHAVWGLGQFAVDGTVSPDLYRFSRSGLGLRLQRLGGRDVKLVMDEGGGVKRVPVTPEERERPSLSEEEARQVARAALALEARYREPQDVEWAIDGQGKLYILQTRPQRIQPWQLRAAEEQAAPELSSARLLVEQAEVASRGIAAGPAWHAQEAGLEEVPEGAVLVVQNTSPAFVAALGRAAALVADRGGSTGHLAIIAREFGVPTLVNARTATASIPEGMEVTVDAIRGRVFEGRLESLLALARRPAAPRMPRESKVYRSLEAVMEHIAPLHLTNPSHRSFRASNCTSIHDITRFAHESAINAMFELNDTWSQSGLVKRLQVRLVPLDLCLIDLGGGLEAGTGQWVRPEQVSSVPMRALLAGMTAEGVRWAGHINIDLKGLFSVFANTLYDPAKAERPLGGRSYAIVSANYVNFSSRLGYHFTVIDAYCSDLRNDNYITFRFKGGAADIERRTRRAVFIGRVLRQLGFWVSQKLDLVNARVKKLERAEIEEKLNMVGRLLGCARQLDVTMINDATVDHYVGEFMRGNYAFAASEAQP
jgi:pyruvate,water dikinase